MNCAELLPPPEQPVPAPSLPGVAPVPRAACADQTVRQRILSAAAVTLYSLLGSRHSQSFGILMYHRTAEPIAGIPRPTWNVPPQRFEQQLTGLLARGFEPWPLKRVLEYHREQFALPPRVFVVTFDDGYENNYLHAFPILKRLRVPATFFLATAYLDSKMPFPNDDWLAAGADEVPASDWRPLATEQCRELQQSGLIELAAHTHTHADFRGRPHVLREDLEVCQTELRERFGIKQPTFAFPYGTKQTGFSGGELMAVAREAGLLCSLTTDSEVVLPGSDPFDWGRFTAEEFDSAATLAAKLSGWYSTVRHVGSAILSQGRKWLRPKHSDLQPEPERCVTSV